MAIARNPQEVLDALGGAHDNLLVGSLDITSAEVARAAVGAATDKFGRIEVLINNAATFQSGAFEEITDAQMRAQIETNLFGPMNVTRAVLPVMRTQRAAHIVMISSLAGAIGQEFCVAYAASKFGVEGWMESLRFDLEPYGIRTTIVEPGFFRTELPMDASTTWAGGSNEDHAERTAGTKRMWPSMNGQRAGGPAKLADALLKVIDLKQPPLRFVAGDDAVPAVEAKGKEIAEQADASRALGTGLTHQKAA